MNFLEASSGLGDREITEITGSTGKKEVREILGREKIDFAGFLALLSPAASEILEELARRARTLTLRHFGRAVNIFAPLYLSNECDNNCLYCGFQNRIREKRVTLGPGAVKEEALFLYRRGFRHLLLVSGENRKKITLPYLEEAVAGVHAYFASTGLEIFPLDEPGYRRLVNSGADSLTIYQEVYDREIYRAVHRGAKADYEYRLETPERAAAAGFRVINLGVLLGLGKWPHEAARLGLHADWLRRKFWRTAVAVSFPRLNPSLAGFTPPHPVSDRQLAQMICALRIFLPSSELVISTREAAGFREKLVPLGITRLSAESKTAPGGYGEQGKGDEQFSVHDARPLEEVMSALKKLGYEAVCKDWDRAFAPVDRKI